MSASSKDSFTKTLLGFASSLSVLVIFFIFYFLLKESSMALSQIGGSRFFSDSTWAPELNLAEGQFGLLEMIIATVTVAILALFIAAPIGWFTAVYIHFFCKGVSRLFLHRVTEIVAGLPSVVLGLWGLVVLVPLLLNIRAPGLSVLAGAIVLAIMIIPTIVVSTVSAYQNLNSELRVTSKGLGIGKARFILEIATPLASRGISTGLVLALARAMGETMVVVMVCGNVVQMPESMLDPVRTLTGNIALEMGYAYGSHQSALFLSGFLLLLSVLTVFITGRLFLKTQEEPVR